MDIGCITGNPHLANELERALASSFRRFTVYPSVGTMTRAVSHLQHDVILLSGDGDILAKFIACDFQRSCGVVPLSILISDSDNGPQIDRALSAGVDDYVSARTGLGQLQTRIRAGSLRRHGAVRNDVLVVGEIRLDRRDFSSHVRGVSVDLTQREFLLAWVLFSNSGSLVTLSMLAEAVWRTPVEVSKRTIEQHIYRLRSKLDMNRLSTLRLTTVYGRGYRIDLGGAADNHGAADFAPSGFDSDFGTLPMAATNGHEAELPPRYRPVAD